MKGKYIVFEGVSGTGKETQAKLLQKFLATKKIKSHIVFHPRAETKLELRKARSTQEQLEILARDRKDVVDHIILPSLAKGEWVISLRNYISAYVYQGDGKEIEEFDPKPDYLFYFDIDPEVSMKRIVSRGEILGKYETPKLLHEKRKKYKTVLQNIPHIDIDASQSIQSIHKEILLVIPA